MGRYRPLYALVDGVVGLHDEPYKMLKATTGPEVDILKGTSGLVRIDGSDLVGSQFGADAGPREGDDVAGAERHDDGSRVPEGCAAQGAQAGSVTRNGERGHVSDEELATA